ncbi:hypothetical protein BGZ83_000638 [Gryganskiella cystojenkinii]|nr:hypothetical protein BGZ83_000638 [Gryganskiella cystojenkinii]
MPLVETLESYSRALYLPLRGYVRRPFQFVTESIREHVPRGLWDIRRAMEHTVLGSSKLVGPFDGFITAETTSTSASASILNNNGSGFGGSLSGAAAVASSGRSSLAVGAGSAATAAAASGPGGAAAAAAKILQVQPSLIQFFTSPYCLLLCFLSIVLNRINAIVAPRNPHPLKLSVRFALKLPALYLLMKSFLITLALLTQDQQSILPLGWMLSSLRTSYNESHALWLSFIAMGVSCTIDSFIANLNSMGNSEQTINMLEWAIMYHFTPFGKDILIISFVQICQLLTLQFLSLSSRGKNYRLAVTTLWGMADLSHFTYAIYHRSGTYPSIQLLTRLPEVVVILMVCVSMALHALTYLVTGGNVRRQMFEPNAMPSPDEEYCLAVFKVGRACMEATRGVGFKNEVDVVVVPFGTILDRKYVRVSKPSRDPASSQQHQQQQHPQQQQPQQQESTFTFTFPFRGSTGTVTATTTRRQQQTVRVPPSGLANEMQDEVDVPGQRNRVSRRLRRLWAIKAFCLSAVRLIVEVTVRGYNRIVPRRFQRFGPSILANRMTVDDYLHLRATIDALELVQQQQQLLFEERMRVQREAAQLDEEAEEEIYKDFLSRDFNESDDIEDELDIDYEDEKEDQDEFESTDYDDDDDAYQEEESRGGEIETFGIRRRQVYEDEEEDVESTTFATAEDEVSGTSQVSLWDSLGSLQDFLLDTSFMTIFMSGRLQDKPLTRSQHRLALAGSREFSSELATSRSNEDDDVGRSRKGSNTQQKDDTETKTLLAVLNRYRKSALNTSKSSLDTFSSSSSSPPSPSSPASSNGMSNPPPLSQVPTSDDDPTMSSRLLCVPHGDSNSARAVAAKFKDTQKCIFLE